MFLCFAATVIRPLCWGGEAEKWVLESAIHVQMMLQTVQYAGIKIMDGNKELSTI